MFEHEQVLVATGARCGLPIVIAVHSTVLGSAAGGCRLRHYPHWRDGLDDALRLSAAMTVKIAVAGLPHGGGKTVVVAPPGTLDPATRRAVLLDVGDLVESLGGTYAIGPDVGTTPQDMVTIAERTAHACCRPESAGGSGDSGPHTAEGVVAAIEAICRHRYGSADLAGRTVSIIGLGSVGGRVARRLATAGAELVVADVDSTKRALAEAIGAEWATPERALTARVDVLVPAALGGLLSHDVVPRLRCAAIAGPANNQLAAESVADSLAQRGICWAPDYVVNAGGVCYALSRELHGASDEQARALVRGIGDRLATILATADAERITPHRAAHHLAAQRLRPAMSTEDAGGSGMLDACPTS